MCLSNQTPLMQLLTYLPVRIALRVSVCQVLDLKAQHAQTSAHDREQQLDRDAVKTHNSQR